MANQNGSSNKRFHIVLIPVGEDRARPLEVVNYEHGIALTCHESGRWFGPALMNAAGTVERDNCGISARPIGQELLNCDGKPVALES